jgi:DNA-binding NtrC family response regulator
MVEAGQFRQDLWFRLNIFPILIPPLRKRKADIPAFVHHFIQSKSRALKLPATPNLAPQAIDQLLTYDWPGNVRELENVVERALILSQGKSLSFDPLLGSPLRDGPDRPGPETGVTASLDETVASRIRQALERTGGKIHGPGGAAALLRINPNTLRSKMDKLGIPYGRQRSGKGTAL